MPLAYYRRVMLVGGPHHGRVIPMNGHAAVVNVAGHGQYRVKPWYEHASGSTLNEAHYKEPRHA